MIEQYKEIYQFVPSVFKTLTNEDKVSLFQDLISYLSNELNIVDDYELEITNNINPDISRHTNINNKKKIQVNKNILNLY